MYRRALLSLYGGLQLPGNRYTNVVCRHLSASSVLWSEKSTPESNGTAKPPGEAADKTSSPHQAESSEPPKTDLASLLGGMKVEVSSKKKFQAMKKKKGKQQGQESADNIESASRMFQMVAEESQTEEEKPVSKELADAASAVASTYPSQQKQVESELLQQLRLHKQMAEEIRRKGSDIRSLYSGKRLKIFPVPAALETSIGTEVSPNLWDLELAKEIAFISEHPPRNGFEEMIQWTKEGKLWTFPVDNEAGLYEEQKWSS
ncbi:hypothetical protein GDO81_004867 [Engystomops pustulosus]|uniref:Small ribosomal subunit protein mS31 n=1 Tax=Engystomops pustulosus TaxID=76066 RepID=A0AAV7CIW3_ENGPU|nr:hypothetical protein GDO81_004867 [Engystomops pustulosus]